MGEFAAEKLDFTEPLVLQFARFFSDRKIFFTCLTLVRIDKKAIAVILTTVVIKNYYFND